MDKSPDVKYGYMKVGEDEKLKSLKWGVFSGAFNAVFCVFTVFGTVFLLFLNELGLSKSLIGVLISIFPFCGLMAPFIAGYVAGQGNKRVHLFCFKLRTVAVSFLIFLPYVVSNYGHGAGVLFVTALIIIFALLRAVGETAYMAWIKEFVPDRVRGKYAAVTTIFSGIASLLALSFAGHIIGRQGGIQSYTFLIGIGCLFGFVSVYFNHFIPGGGKICDTRSFNYAKMILPFKDMNYRLFLGALGFSHLGVMMMIFTPLFLAENIGISPESVVLFDRTAIAGSLLLCFLWGWMSDRFGSRPVLMLSLWAYAAVPLGWLFIRADLHGLLFFVPVLYFLTGAATSGRGVADSRLLWAWLVPEEGASNYTALFYAWIGLVGGMAPLMAGYLLNLFSSLRVVLMGREINAYSIIFLLNFIFQIASIYLYRKVKPDKRIKTRHILRRMVRRAMRW